MKIAVLGDSIAQGFSSEDHATEAYPIVLGNILGWTVFNAGTGGTGYLRESTPGAHDTYADKLASVLAQAPDVILVQGSNNDLPGYGGEGWNSTQIADAASSLFRTIRAALPSVRLIVTFPLFKVRGLIYPLISDALYTGLRTAMLNALPGGAEWIDPVTTEWITGTGISTHPRGDGNGDTYLADGIHPTTAGHAYLATRFVDAFTWPTGLPGPAPLPEIEAWVTTPAEAYIAHLDRSQASPFRRFAVSRMRGADPGVGSLEYHRDNALVSGVAL